MDQTTSPETQKMLNTPPVNPQGFDPADQAFLNQIVANIDGGKINLYAPSSLLNHAVYDGMPGDRKSKVDTQSFSLLAALREVYGLWKAYQNPTYQLLNLLHKIRLTKEQFETEQGDVFII